ncbi:MAG: hypothetical protein QG622_13 [Actinomycetota bacterium]|nr:hypothetical protein [Actinomycetota bacterium]
MAMVVLLGMTLIGAGGCSTGVSTVAIPSTADTDRVCHMFSAAAVRTVSGEKAPAVEDQEFLVDSAAGRLSDGRCVLRAGDVYLRADLRWKPTAADRAEARSDLSSPPKDVTVRSIPDGEGIGFVRTTRAAKGQVVGALLRGQYELALVLTGVPEPRDSLTDAQALILQMADALAIPVSESAERPKAPRG